LEANRLRVRFKRGTVAIGALAIVAIFMIAISCITIIVMEYSRFAYSVKVANEAIVTKAKEKLRVQASSSSGATTITVTNIGSTSSLVIGVYAINPVANDHAYYKLSRPVNIAVLGEKTFTIPHTISNECQVGVLTSLGNVFWEA